MSQGAGRCPGCRSSDTKVTNTRHKGDKTIRDHLCRKCGKRWKTTQAVARYVGWA